MTKDYLGAGIAKLGFGLMRLPMKDGEVDIGQVKEMVDIFMKKGFTYFDTAYVYHGGKSEAAVKEALSSRYPRASYQLATKLPIWEVKEPADMQKIVDTQLERTGAGYFDFYLLHAIDEDNVKRIEEVGAWDFAKDLKARGIAKHIGFSFHDSAKVLDEVLTKHPEAEFVQLQINYIDWESDSVQARANYETAMKHNVPVVVMEPVKGGSLAAMAPAIQGIFKQAKPSASVASWAVRFAASLPGIVTVLSGMSTMEQLADNLSSMSGFQALDDGERAVIAQVVEKLNAIPTVPCTQCEYCVSHCPQSIAIPGVISAYNNFKIFENFENSKGHYAWSTGKGGKASACIACGACESHCPQHIAIIDTLKQIAELFE